MTAKVIAILKPTKMCGIAVGNLILMKVWYDVADSELLMTLCKRLTAPDPLLRYASAEDANTGPEGLADFQRSLVIGDLASEYDNELRVWLEDLD